MSVKIVPHFSLLSSDNGTEIIYARLNKDKYEIIGRNIPFGAQEPDDEDTFNFNCQSKPIFWTDSVFQRKKYTCLIDNENNVTLLHHQSPSDSIQKNELEELKTPSNLICAKFYTDVYIYFLQQNQANFGLIVFNIVTKNWFSLSIPNQSKVCRFALSSKLLAVAFEDNTIDFFNINLDKSSIAQEKTLHISAAHFGAITDISFTADEQHLYTSGSDGLVKYWNLNRLSKGPEAVITVSTSPVMSVRPNPIDETLFVASSIDGFVHVMSVKKDGPPKQSFSNNDNKYEPFIWADFSPADCTLVVASSASSIHLFYIDYHNI